MPRLSGEVVIGTVMERTDFPRPFMQLLEIALVCALLCTSHQPSLGRKGGSNNEQIV